MAGDVAIFPHADAHRMSSHSGVLSEEDITPQVLNFIRSAPPDAGIPQIEYGRAGEAAHIVCGYLQCDQRFNPLIGSLPRVLLVVVSCGFRGDQVY
jgi:hypothetical protein